MYQHGWQREKQHWSRRIQRKEMLPKTTTLSHAYHLSGSCWLVSWRKKYMRTFLRRMCYWMSRRNAGKTHEERRINSWSTSRFWSTVRNTTVVSKKDYYMVPHPWMIEAMKIVGITDKIMNLFENSKETWRIELVACNERLGKLILGEGSFRGILFHTCFLLLFLYLYW